MKPWEETWEAREAIVYRDDGQWVGRLSPSPGVSPDFEAARAKLAAQAPAMARLLLKLQWIDVDRGEGCPSCGMFRGSGHAADCEIVAVLRVAGVTS